MDFKGRIIGISRDYFTKLCHLHIEVCEKVSLEAINNKYGQDKLLSVHMVQYYKPKTGQANRYMWELCDQIADYKNSKMKDDMRPHSKDSVYVEMLLEYGSWYTYEGTDQTVELIYPSDVDLTGFKATMPWNDKEVSVYWKPVGQTPDGKTIYQGIKGTSGYNTKEMSKLLDGIVYTARDCGIDTRTDYEHEKMIEEWAKSYEKAQKHNNR